MYTNTFKNELTTDQKHKLLLNTCGILFYCRNGAKSTALKRMQTVQGSLLCFLFCLRKVYSFKTYANCTGFIIMFFILFDFILNIPVNNFSVISGQVFLG